MYLNHNKLSLNRFWRSPYRLTIMMCFFLGLCACTSTPNKSNSTSYNKKWALSKIKTGKVLYQYAPASQHYILEAELSEPIKQRFADTPSSLVIDKVSQWLMSEEGWGVRFDPSANFTPRQIYQEKRANCISFSLLLYSIAQEMNVPLHINSIDIPNTWGYAESIGMIFYRHVNAIQFTTTKRLIFDLSLPDYDSNFPQKTISYHQALALFHSNSAINAMQHDDLENAELLLKTALYLDAKNPDIWSNLGTLYRKKHDDRKAERAFVYASQLNHKHLISASNLERLYREQNKPTLVKQYRARAQKAKRSNPYFYYKKAIKEYENKKYKKAQRHIKKAITLYDGDHRFYELQTKIQAQIKTSNASIICLYTRCT